MTFEKLGEISVSRETIARLKDFADLIEKWSPRINLVSRNSLDNLWDRHIVDSAQLFALAGSGNAWTDLGSGGGFPGLVVAILSAEQRPERRVTLIESDTRKCVFLKTVIRELDLSVEVLTSRIEQAPPANADILSARALSQLTTLLDYASRHLSPSGAAIFPKGENWRKEVAAAKERWSFDLEEFTSWTEPRAAILRIRGINRV